MTSILYRHFVGAGCALVLFSSAFGQQSASPNVVVTGEDESGRLHGRHIGTGIVRPNFWERARYYNLERELADALDKVNQ